MHLKGVGTALALVAGIVTLGWPPQAHAYVDPGVGAMLVQLLLGGVAGFLVILKLYWHRIKAVFAREQPPATSAPESSDNKIT